MGYLTGILAALIASSIALQQGLVLASFQDETQFYWGADRGQVTGPDTVELRLNKTGGTGIKSTASYMYGSVTMLIKLVQGNSAGTVTTFYLSSEGDKHDEIDFEFLGNSTGEPYTIHTNIFTQGVGGREEQFKPWFDATDGYHNYTILWDIYNVVWIVDDIPIRVFKNFHNNKINFPDAQPMKAYASLWNAENWATQGGRVKTDWTLAPFVATLENYKADTCECSDASGVAKCSAVEPANWWTDSKYEKIDDAKISQMNWIRNNYMIYNYCTKTELYNATTFPQECNLAQY